MILTDDILPNPMQPRRSFDAEAVARLAESIRLHGIIQPLCVRELEPPSYGYGLIAGERRLRAAKLLGLERVPCIISAADGKRCAELAIVENLQREDLNMFEQAMAIGELMELHCLTQEKIAAELSCSQSYVANKLRLLKLTREDMELILSEGLTERHARTFLRIKDPEARGRAMRTVVRRRMNVAATEEYVDSLLSPKPPKGETAQGKTTVVLRDLRIFHNTLDKALDFIKKAGVPVETVRRDEGEHTEITIRLPRR
jgi:ParB family chromosome partitioning protein